MHRQITLADVTLNVVTERQAVERVAASLRQGDGGWVITVNLDILRQSRKSPWLHQVIQEADLVVADGMPLIWAARLQGTPLPERVAGSSMVSSLAEAVAPDRQRLFLLGGAEGVAARAADVLRSRYPGLEVVGTYAPPMGFEKDPAELDRMQRMLRETSPNLVYVALGCPKQERLIAQLKPGMPGVWWLGIGISLSFLCGDVTRAPRWVQRMGLEWLHRMFQEPRRLIRRYLIDGLPFAFWLLAHSLRQRRRVSRPSI